MINARVVELVDTAVLEAVAERLESSSLSLGTEVAFLNKSSYI